MIAGQLAWIVLAALLLWLWGRALRRARDPAAHPVAGRTELLAAAGLTLACGLGGGWVWGGAVAADGLARIGEGSPGTTDRSPPRARLFLRHVQIPLGKDGRATVGYAPATALVLPRDYGLTEASRGRDVLALEARGPRGLEVTSRVDAGSPTRVLVTEGSPASLVVRGRCVAASPPITGDGAVTVVLCDGDTPRAALVLDRELGVRDAPAGDSPIRAQPLVWRGSAFGPHHVQVEAGTLLQIGAVVDALPGLTVWEIPAPTGRPGLLFPPRDLLAGCSSWLHGNSGAGDGGFFFPGLGVVEGTPPPASGDEAFACVLPFTPPFALEVRRLLPDPVGAFGRAAWGGVLVVAPALALLLGLALGRASSRSPTRAAPALALAFVSAAVALVVILRLVWAHRLDMMRDYEPLGARVLANTEWALLAAAALGATAGALWIARARPRHAILASLVGWLVTLGAGAWALGGPLALGGARGRFYAQAAVSLVLGLAMAVWPLLAPRLRDRVRAPIWALGALGIAAVGCAVWFPRVVALKLALAWAFVPLAYLTLRTRNPLSLPLALVVLVALMRFDTGVSVVIAAPGLLLALLVFAHDAVHDADDTRHPVRFTRHFRPVIVWQTVGTLAVALPIIGWALAGLAGGEVDPLLPQALTHGALQLPGIAALLFAGLGWAIARKRGVPAARIWFAIALVLGVGWAARDVLIGRVIASSSEAAARVASILDPAYALVADERAFAKGLTAWRETQSSAPLAGGQGFFGAQVVDAGVLLSIENDYLPILLLRETGAFGLARLIAVFFLVTLGLWQCGAGRFQEGSASLRARRAVALLFGLACLYQPVASLGALPFTGIAWPGLGIDSPSDLWIFVALLLGLALWREAPETPPASRRLDSELRSTSGYRKTALLVGGAAAAMAVAGELLVARAGTFALRRPEPAQVVRGDTGEAVVHLAPPFDGLEAVLDHVHRMQCAPGAELAMPLFPPPPPGSGLARFHAAWQEAWQDELPAAQAQLARVRGGGACEGRSGHWRYEPRGTDCLLRFDLGWPVVEYAASAKELRCEVRVPEGVLRAFRYPPRRPYAGARVRLVAEPLGRAAADRGELVSGGVLVRLRPGAGRLDLATASAGIYFADRIELEGGLVLVAGTPPTIQRVGAQSTPARVLTPRGAPRVHVYGAEDARWDTRLLEPAAAPTPLDTLSVIVTGGGGRSVWLYRPTDAPPLLADDVATVLGSSRRFYAWGSVLPELGWVNPAGDQQSLGLDGWAHAAAAAYERPSPGGAAPPSPGTPSAQARFAAANCGTLAPAVPPEAGAAADDAFADVCAPSPIDGVLECRVALQPELALRLRHLLELTAQRPELFAAPGGKTPPRPATAASYALLRGDTGEILAQGTFVPGRETTAYSPSTPSLLRYLVDARDSRDEETGAERADWGEALAVGSVAKPLLARALERAAPEMAAQVRFTAAGPRAGCEPVLGHCPPTKTLWNHPEMTGDLPRFLGESLNWVQAAVGLLGTALPDGEIGFGDEPATLAFPLAVESIPEDRPLWTRSGGRDVIVRGAVDLGALRQTPMWRELEALLGRPLCEDGKRACMRAAARRDLCAARSLPVDRPSADLRHLVALGPSTFDFSDSDTARRRQPVREYLQLLRGAGKHPLGTTLQLADAYTRLFFEANPGPRYRLAASWFPAPSVGKPPPPCDGRSDGPVRDGLCLALREGTASALGKRGGDAGIVLYGAKTGTIDSLGDVAESREACARWNRAHTVPGSKEQPYHLDCDDPERKDLNDSLLALGFGVKVWGGEVLPLTLVVRYQRVGSGGPHGYAVDAAGAFLDVIADYFAAR